MSAVSAALAVEVTGFVEAPAWRRSRPCSRSLPSRNRFATRLPGAAARGGNQSEGGGESDERSAPHCLNFTAICA